MQEASLRKLISICDHTLLSPIAKKEDVIATVDDAIKYGAASVCIPPFYVKEAFDHADGRIKICTVIGFPLGYSTSHAKAEEARDAVKQGAHEIDMVINIGSLKRGDEKLVLEDIKAVRSATEGKVLKVIIETAYLTEEEKILACKTVTEGCADFIKTSTGFAERGATPEDVALMKQHVGENVKIKAAGGISSIEDAEALVKAGADRLGSSKLIKIAKEMGL